jgi:CRISPR system Cascade subunit CasB
MPKPRAKLTAVFPLRRGIIHSPKGDFVSTTNKSQYTDTSAEPVSERFSAGSVCLDWWTKLNGLENIATRNTGHIAELRRASTIVDVVKCPSYHNLTRRFPHLQNHGECYGRLDRLAVVAHVLAHVRKHDSRLSFAKQMGRPPEGKSTPPVSELRFRRFVQVTRNEDLMQAARRMVALLGGDVNVTDLAESIVWWNTPRRMKTIAFDYYQSQEITILNFTQPREEKS